ncbi:FAD-dependent oxidoreductase [Pseudonocardia humida]|uniref:FAD-dependent monooxygenase n=1 Tax=Pseudonocardia humida TaxID=2800819 RepID=A0ABT1ACM3_9PSEU|nr:FAD-dependent oxidoreductase [Pseudonocardia humida]MCO1660819.1 FAD-dependent monooxygenase [Pseudonocardia humida]
MNTETETQVVIVGAGPVGLMLAAELRLAGVETVVLERLEMPSPHSKALGVHARTLEQLAMRGLVDPFLAGGIPVPAWHFGFLSQRLDLTRLDTPYPFMLAFPQHRTEAVLLERALALGARIRRGRSVTGLTQDDDEVRVVTESGETWRAGWVIGADGAGSTVRQTAGIEFPGTDADTYAYLGDAHADSPPPPGYGVLNERGALIVAPLPGGRFRFTGFDPEHQDSPRRDLTIDELQETVRRISGTDFDIRDPAWLTRFGNATRVAATYRRRRVLLAGDAAHMHFPAGGVGLNLGLQDAMNLGWKLAAVVQGRADAGLLDTYHDERHPWAEDVAEHTLAQTALIRATTPTGLALRQVLSDLITDLPDLSLKLARRLAGLDVHYGRTDQHRLVGARVTATGDALLDGRAALVGSPGHAMIEQAATAGIPVQPLTVDASAAVIRPDGYVWWATDDPDDDLPDLVGRFGGH